MKTMNRMRMQDCWCYSCMMAMAMKGSVYIIKGVEQIKHQYHLG